MNDLGEYQGVSMCSAERDMYHVHQQQYNQREVIS